MPTGDDFVAAFFGCLYAGIVAVPCPPPLPGAMAERFADIVADCTPELLVTTAEWAALMPASGMQVVAADALLGWAEFAPVEITAHDIAYLQYSSGTTGKPRGIVVRHANALANLRLSSADHALTSDDRIVGWLPLFHDLGLVSQILQPIFDDSRAVLMQPQDFVADPARWLREVSTQAATIVALPGFAYDMLLRRVPPEQRAALRLDRLRIARTAADELDPERMRAFTDGFAVSGLDPIVLNTGYGLGEAVLHVCITPPGTPVVTLRADRDSLSHGILRSTTREDAVTVVGSGRPGADLPVAIVSREDRRLVLPDGRVGEIAIAGASVVMEYWGEEETGFDIDGVRYQWTGDLGCLLDGELFVLGRTADLLVVDGREYRAADIERTAAKAYPRIRPHACAVFADTGSIVLVAELVDGHDMAAQAVRAAVAARHDLVLDDIHFVARGAVPVTTSGKVRRRRAAEFYRRQRPTSAAQS